MNFITIGQYFNKLQSALFILLISPLLIFIALYFLGDGIPPDPPVEYYMIIASAVVLDWLVAIILFNKKIKSVRDAQGLGAKLDNYFQLTIIRYALLSSASLVLAIGFYLWKSDIFTVLYLAGLLLAGLLWPTARKVSSDLKLRGDEREMVYFKKDNFNS